MKRALTLLGIILISLPIGGWGQCTLANYGSMTILGPSNFPFFAAGPGVTITASAPGVPTLGNFSYPCNGQSFTCASPTWWLNASNQVITLNFSCPIAKFSVVVNGTNLGEVFTFTGSSGTTTLSDYCTSFSTVLPNQLIDNISPATGTLITINNPTGATSYQLTHNGVGSGSRISLLDCFICATPFAVNLSSFEAEYRTELQDVMLNWQTENEVNSNGFEVQHSLDGEVWEVLGFVKGASNSNSRQSYEFLHGTPIQGLNYYRLRQVDLDANYRFSEIRTINVSPNGPSAEIFPNPTSGHFEVRAEGRKGTLEVTDMMGRILMQHPFESHLQLDLSGQAKGVYLIKVSDQRYPTSSQRLLLQ